MQIPNIKLDLNTVGFSTCIKGPSHHVVNLIHRIHQTQYVLFYPCYVSNGKAQNKRRLFIILKF